MLGGCYTGTVIDPKYRSSRHEKQNTSSSFGYKLAGMIPGVSGPPGPRIARLRKFDRRGGSHAKFAGTAPDIETHFGNSFRPVQTKRHTLDYHWARLRGEPIGMPAAVYARIVESGAEPAEATESSNDVGGVARLI